MTDERNERQRAADTALDDAVREVIAAYDEANNTDGWDARRGVVTHWITLVSSVGHDDDGSYTTTSILHPYGGGTATPWPEVFGLLRCGQLRLERDYLTPDD